jgi:hypothetical protein
MLTPALFYPLSGPVLWLDLSFKLKNGYICHPLDGRADVN